jgi:hypothetical protein
LRISEEFIGARLASVAIVTAIGFGYVAYIFWPHCDREEKILASDSLGRSIVSCFEACTSLGTSMEESIELKSASGKMMTILKYEPNGGIVGCRGKIFPENHEISVDWSNASVIRISICVVSAISKINETMDGVRVIYDIGTIISRDCRFARRQIAQPQHSRAFSGRPEADTGGVADLEKG